MMSTYPVLLYGGVPRNSIIHVDARTIAHRALALYRESHHGQIGTLYPTGWPDSIPGPIDLFRDLDDHRTYLIAFPHVTREIPSRTISAAIHRSHLDPVEGSDLTAMHGHSAWPVTA